MQLNRIGNDWPFNRIITKLQHRQICTSSSHLLGTAAIRKRHRQIHHSHNRINHDLRFSIHENKKQTQEEKTSNSTRIDTSGPYLTPLHLTIYFYEEVGFNEQKSESLDFIPIRFVFLPCLFMECHVAVLFRQPGKRPLSREILHHS